MRVVVNAAMSVDGKLATRQREPVRISGPRDFDRVDVLRAEVDAVLVGVGTVRADDPSLTVDDEDRLDARESAGRPRQPTRIVADSRARTPTDARVLDDAARSVVLVADSAAPDAVADQLDAAADALASDRKRVADRRGSLADAERTLATEVSAYA
jgi:2,5-diamino-6-(ribosylamino)-4(3H)-pyrimidinone 5'-phosphate reductase